jgi:vancomycin resistance protein YoaR
MTKRHVTSIFKIIAVIFLSLLILTSIAFAGFAYYFKERIFPNVYVAGVNVGGKTNEEAKELLTQKVQIPEKITLKSKDKPLELSLKEIELTYDFDTTIEKAYQTYRTNDFLTNILSQDRSFAVPTTLPIDNHINEKKLDEYLDVIANSLETEAKYPSAALTNGSVTIDPGKSGETVDFTFLRGTIIKDLSYADFSSIPVNYQTVNPSLSPDEIQTFKETAEKLIGKTLTLSYEFTTYKLTGQKLISLLDPQTVLSEDRTKALITKDVAPLFNRPTQNAAFKLVDNKVEEFKPAKPGVELVQDTLIQNLKSKVSELSDSESKELTLEVPVKTANPTVTTNEVNNLGINELIGRGTSVFKGSIASRVYNVGFASGKLNGVLIPPNTTFSFDDTVGDVSALTGYKQAYIIQNGRTVLGDGGGLCQVSTTLFRAAMNAGLPIVERRAHAYRVGYYEQDSGPGLDATVYVPTTDFKFKNDTPNTILIQTIFDAKAMTLAFELYGTKDGRVATVSKPIITKQIAPADDLYVDDPTLPTGKVNQVEHKAWGATVKFDYTVTRNGEQIYQKTFTSVYQPWQAVYMRGTGPAV